MKTKLAIAAVAVLLSGPTIMPAAAFAHPSGYYDQNHVYHRGTYHYRHRCGGGNGAVGTIAGGVGGGLLGHALGGGTLGTLAGAGGGALLGRHLDKKHTEDQRRKEGC